MRSIVQSGVDQPRVQQCEKCVPVLLQIPTYLTLSHSLISYLNLTSGHNPFLTLTLTLTLTLMGDQHGVSWGSELVHYGAVSLLVRDIMYDQALTNNCGYQLPSSETHNTEGC